MNDYLRYELLDEKQVAAANWLSSGEDGLLCADVGTGKTVITATAMRTIRDKDIADDNDPVRWLVLAPPLVCSETWLTEFTKWQHLRNFFKVGDATGTPEERTAVVEDMDIDVVVMNYEKIDWLLRDYCPKKAGKGKPDPLADLFQGVIYDEVDKLKTISSERFKALRHRIPAFEYRFGLTGTVLPNELTEIWGQVYMVDGGESFKLRNDLGVMTKSFAVWQRKYFYPTDHNQRNWVPFPDTEDTVLDAIEDVVYRLPADRSQIPPLEVHDLIRMDLPDEVRTIYDTLGKDLHIELKRGGRTVVLDADGAAVAQGKLQQICAGFSYHAPTECRYCRDSNARFYPHDTDPKAYACSMCQKKLPRGVLWHTRARQLALQELICTDIGRDEQVLIVVQFNEERDELKRMFGDKIAHIDSKQPAKKTAQVIADWNSGKLQYLAIHPASAGHGLNLQHSGAKHIVFMTFPWSGGMFTQVCGRLARRGSSVDRVHVWGFAFRNTVDVQVPAVVKKRVDYLESFHAKLPTFEDFEDD